MNTTKLKIFVGFLFCITVWEHVATQNEFEYKPTFFLNAATGYVRPFFKCIGEFIGIVCSLFEHIKNMFEYIKKLFDYIKFGEYIKSIGTLFWSLSDLLMSWVWVFFGYVEYVCNLTQISRELTIFGSFLIAVVVAAIIYKYLGDYLMNIDPNTTVIISAISVALCIFAAVYVAAYYQNLSVRDYLTNIHKMLNSFQ